MRRDTRSRRSFLYERREFQGLFEYFCIYCKLVSETARTIYETTDPFLDRELEGPSFSVFLKTAIDGSLGTSTYLTRYRLDPPYWLLKRKIFDSAYELACKLLSETSCIEFAYKELRRRTREVSRRFSSSLNVGGEYDDSSLAPLVKSIAESVNCAVLGIKFEDPQEWLLRSVHRYVAIVLEEYSREVEIPGRGTLFDDSEPKKLATELLEARDCYFQREKLSAIGEYEDFLRFSKEKIERVHKVVSDLKGRVSFVARKTEEAAERLSVKSFIIKTMNIGSVRPSGSKAISS